MRSWQFDFAKKNKCRHTPSQYPVLTRVWFLYARLQTGRIMVWWCPSGSPSGSPSVRPVSVRPFSALFSYMLWHIELKFCTWLCFNALQIKFECHHFATIFEGVMPLCELRIWEIHSFPHFSPTWFYILSWNFVNDFVLMYYRASSSVISLRQFLKELCLFWNLNIGNTQFSAVFSCMLWHIELKFCTWLCFNVLQIQCECHHFTSIFEGVMPLLELRI